MSDETYQPGVYKKQGGNELVVADGGKITVEAGGEILIEDGTAAGEGLSPLIWGDCPRLQMLIDPTIGVLAGDDFTQVLADGFPYLVIGANGTFLPLAAQQYGVARLLATGADNDECNVSYNDNLAGMIKANATDNWWFEARVKVSQITLGQGVFVGLAEEAGVGADFMTDDTMALKVIDNLGFQIIAATDIAAIWQTQMTLNGGARAAISATAGTAAVAYVKLGMKSVLGVVTFYIDGVALDDTVASTATNYPLDQIMCPTFATKCGQGTANSLDVDWWYAAQLR